MKKIFNIINTCLIVGLGLFISSCDKFLGDNISPNSLKQSPYPLVFSAGQAQLVYHLNSDLFLFSSIFTQQAAGQGSATQPRFFDQYIVTNSDVNNAFSFFYTGALPDLNYVITESTAQGSPVYAGMSRIMQAFMFGILVDSWGKVPYSQALKGLVNAQPVYDDDKAIYEALFDLIDQGVAELDQPSAQKPSASQDLIYGGDVAKWKRFANTLKLRLALNYAKVDNGQRLRSLINAASGDTFMTANTDNFQLTFEDNTNRQNPIDRFEVSRADQYFPSAFLVNLMNTRNDPRRVAFFTHFPYNADTYVGAATTSGQSVNFSRIHTYLRGSIKTDNGNDTRFRNTQGGLLNNAIVYSGTAPIRMLTFAEYNFIRAEAALVYGASGDAAGFFEAGIGASLSDVAAYVPLSATVTYNSATTAYVSAQTAKPLTQELILEEKYIANYGVSIQPWTDYRRTGFPQIPVSEAAIVVNNNVLPRVLPYPLSEQSVNPANVPARPSMAVKSVFWDN